MKFKDFYIIEKVVNDNILLSEGGAGAHMAHPYDVLSPDDLLDFFDRLLNGDIETREKFDGQNIVVGYNEDGDVVFTRSPNEKMTTDIEAKFPLSHPAGDVFRAAFTALKKSLGRLSKTDRKKYKLIDEDGKPIRCLNLEIMMKKIPNIIEYSDVDNFLVFHNYLNTYINNYAPIDDPNTDQLLNSLSDKLKEETVNSEVVYYTGDIGGKITKTIKKENSDWKFVGPTKISKEKLSSELKKVASKWKKFPEVMKLKNWKTMPKDELNDVMKKATEKIGSEILINLTSTLFSGKRLTPHGHPRIEGLVAKLPSGNVKITGDFNIINQKLWGPLKMGLGKPIKDLNSFILNDVLEIPKISEIQKRMWIQARENSVNFLTDRSSNPKLDRKVNINTITVKIENSLKTIAKTFEEVVTSNNLKKDDLLKTLRMTSMKLMEFKTKLTEVNNVVDLLDTYVEIMLGLSVKK
jgi:hypothetical protein